MMIHVFYVNRGDMLMFDMSHAVESVMKLQLVISEETGIPFESQVLLISGGETMSPNSRVCSYSAGTDTCPIFLFNLRAIEEKNPPEITQENDNDGIRQRIEGSINMAPTLATLSTRTQLSLDLRDLSHRHETLCKTLVHHQHLQHQGWSTVVANLEDTLQAFIEQAEKFSSWYQTFLEKKQTYGDMLHGFPESHGMLSKMPLLGSLVDILNGSVYCGRFSHQAPTTLMQFLTALENNQNLLEEAENTLSELVQLDEELLSRLLAERDKVLVAADNASMKEVKGVENRLYGLEQLIVNASKIVKDQEAYAQSFVHNQTRCRQLADPNILPDLCASHKEQLRVMENNDQSLRDIAHRCTDTKRELSANLHTRLRWIMWVEKVVSSVDGKIALHYENCRRLKIRIDKLDQIYRAPSVYAQLCAEVCRRRKFALEYKHWSHSTYEKSSDWHQREVEHRKDFYKSIGPHFLKTLFPGLDKLPPAIMMTTVTGVDDELPPVNDEELKAMKESIPELEPYLRLPVVYSQLSVDLSNSPRSVKTAVQSQETSDIAVLSPRTNQSSQSSPDSAEDIEHSIDEENHPKSLCNEQQMEESDQSMHRMARFSESHGGNFSNSDEDISAVTDDEQAPASLTEDHSGGFMTAQFYLSDEQESLNPRPADNNAMAETITLQNSEIEKLMSENYSYKNKCEHLTQVIQALRQTVDVQLQDLKKSGKDVRQDLKCFEGEFRTAQQLMIETVPRLHQAGIDECLEQVQQSGNERVIQLTQQCNAQDAEMQQLQRNIGEYEARNKQLVKDMDMLQAEYDSIQSASEQMSAHHKATISEMEGQHQAFIVKYESEQHVKVENLRVDHQKELDEMLDKNRSVFDEMKANHEEELERAMSGLRKQLTLEHELELDQFKETLNEQLHSKQCEVTAQDAEIEGLKTDIEELQQKLKTQSVEHDKAVEKLKQQLAEQSESQVAQLTQAHESSVKQLFEKLENLESNVIALEQQKSQLEAEHHQQLMAMQKSLLDQESNTDTDYLEGEISALRDQFETENRKAIEEVTQQCEEKLKSSLEEQSAQFQHQMEQVELRHEQELEYRAVSMKESLQAVNEVRFNEKISHVKKEKDAIIAELRRQLNSLSTQQLPGRVGATGEDTPMSTSVMTESVVPASPRDTERLEEQLGEKEDMIKTLQARVSAFEMSASSRELIHSDKVTVKSCGKGDKVILCFDERYEHYVVFSLSTTLHFVHTDSLKDLDLAQTTAPGTKRRPWVLAEIIDKEYCQARKPNNRFKVPVNTKFYRVKAKTWTVI